MRTTTVIGIIADLQDDNEIILDADLQMDSRTLEEDFGTGFNLGGTNDYLRLKNKPSINGVELIDNYDEIDPTVPDWAKNQEKPKYTANEVEAVDRNYPISRMKIDTLFAEIFGT